MNLSPVEFSCSHVATPAEQRRDPNYQGCAASAGQPCFWAKRWDGVADPAFHTERLELAWAGPVGEADHAELVRSAALNAGLV